MKRYRFLYSLLAVVLLGACSEDGNKDFVIQPTFEEPVENPIKSAQAQDGSEWIDGTITGHTINFVFRWLGGDQLKNVQVRFTVDEGATMINPETSPVTLDLSGDQTVAANNGYSDVEYTIKATEYPLLKGVTVKIGREINIAYTDGGKNIVINSFAPNATAATVTLDLNEGAVPVSPATVESVQDLSSPFTIKVKDSKTGGEKQYTLTINTDWENVTSELVVGGVSLPNFMTIYRNSKLHGREGNKGYVVKIPAGSVDMKISHKVKVESSWFSDDQRVSEVVAANQDYNLFVTGIATIYYKGIVRNLAMNNGVVIDDGTGTGKKAVGWRHWNVQYYTSPPTLGVKDGKASIAYADVMADEKLYKFAPSQHGSDKSLFTGGVEWNVDAAVSGYAMPLKNGEVQIKNESAADYKALADLERNHVFNNVKAGMEFSNYSIVLAGASGETKPKVQIADAQRMARNMVGVTAEGDLMIFVSERYSGTNNVLKTVGDPSDGSTLQEAATVLKEFSCVDAMALHHIQHAVVAMQDRATGKDLTRTDQRTDKVAGTDVLNGTVLMFK